MKSKVKIIPKYFSENMKKKGEEALTLIGMELEMNLLPGTTVTIEISYDCPEPPKAPITDEEPKSNIHYQLPLWSLHDIDLRYN